MTFPLWNTESLSNWATREVIIRLPVEVSRREQLSLSLSAPVVAATDPVKKETPRVWTCSDSKCDTEISLSIAWLIRGFLWTLEAGGVELDWKIVVKAVLLGLWGVGC